MTDVLRIVLAVDSYPPVPKAGGIQMRDLAGALAALGHDVTVLAPDPTLRRTAVFEEGGVRLVRVRAGDTKRVGRAKRALNELRLSSQLWSAYRGLPLAQPSPDLFVWYSPTIFFGPLAHWMRQRGAFSYLILRDIFPDWALEMGVLKPGPVYWAFKGFEWLQYAAADVIGVQSPNNLKYFDRYPARGRREVLHNWRNLAKPPTRQNSLGDYNLLDRKVIVFGGTMGVAQDLDNILRLAARLRDKPEVALLLVGEGSEKTRLEKAARDQGLDNVVFAPGLPEAQFEALLSECHVGLISLHGSLRTHNIPGKLLSYLKMGLPVVASINRGNDLAQILADSGAGISKTNGDDAGLAEAVMSICADDHLHAEMGRNAEALGRAQFAAESAALQILAAVEARPTINA